MTAHTTGFAYSLVLGDLATWATVLVTLLIALCGALWAFFIFLRSRREAKRSGAEQVNWFLEPGPDGAYMLAIRNGGPDPIDHVFAHVRRVDNHSGRDGEIDGEDLSPEGSIGPYQTVRIPVMLGGEFDSVRLEATMYFQLAEVLWVRGTGHQLIEAEHQDAPIHLFTTAPIWEDDAEVELHPDDADARSRNHAISMPTQSYSRTTHRVGEGNQWVVRLLPHHVKAQTFASLVVGAFGKPLATVELDEHAKILTITVHNARTATIAEMAKSGPLTTPTFVREPDDSLMIYFASPERIAHLTRLGVEGITAFPIVLSANAGSDPPIVVCFDKETGDLATIMIQHAHDHLHPAYLAN